MPPPIIIASSKHFDPFIYSGKWISSGASNGGITSVYHRRFYPDDVDRNIAYVVRHSFAQADPRYLNFVANLEEPGCRAQLADFQRELLKRRAALIDIGTSIATTQSDAFKYLHVFAPGKKHSAALINLVNADRSVAFDALKRKTGKHPHYPQDKRS